jgi:rhamnulose-1-phosphate aldolase/alcohol dehydrogenase
MSGKLASLWNEREAERLDEVDLLVYRSNLLGSDPRITNFGGGNTSAKTEERDPLTGENVRVLWVKGSGGDLGTMKRSGLASLYLERVLGLEERFRAGLHEDEIVPLYPHCTFGLNPTASSIDTPLHAFVPRAHVDHLHPDAVIAIAASEDAERLTAEAFGGEVGYLPWKRPGFELGLQLRDLYAAQPELKGAVLGGHGLICWADTGRECYELSLRLINQAQAFLDAAGRPEPFGAAVREAEPSAELLASLLPRLRGRCAHDGQRLIAHCDTSRETMQFLASERLEELAALGTSCPDHFLRTKIRPMLLHSTEAHDLEVALDDYRRGYEAYYERCRRNDSPPMRNPNPSVVLAPGVGMIAFGKTKQEARVTAEFYRRAIEVMRGAESVSRYQALAEQEAFGIEYWQLEEAKLRRMPPERELSRQIALITGGAQGIGLATAKKLAAEGACVALLDLNEDRLAAACGEIEGQVLAIRCDVTDPEALRLALQQTVLEFGGLDIAVACAGNARRGTVADTSDEDYDFLSDLLMKAYFTTLREAARIMIEQGTGGSLVVVGSKNGAAVGSNAAVYSAAKAFELHLMRASANDLAPHGIRCNAVNPDAVLEGSGIWSDRWREETARSLGIAPDDLEEHYRKRSLLGVAVRPEDVAEAVFWLCSSKSSRTTGCTIPVDGGNREGFLR